MYNRYIRNDNGEYQRVPMPDAPPSNGPAYDAPPPPQPEGGGYDPFRAGDGPYYGPPPNGPPPPNSGPPPQGGKRSGNGFLSGILSSLHLDGIDTGDLLLLLILLLLFKDGEDEEMLIALGLLLIL